MAFHQNLEHDNVKYQGGREPKHVPHCILEHPLTKKFLKEMATIPINNLGTPRLEFTPGFRGASCEIP